MFLLFTQNSVKWKLRKLLKNVDRHAAMRCVTISPVPYVFLLEFFGENENYTFLEGLESCESENQC